MFFHFLKTALRNFIKQKQFTLLNITGLSTGLAAAILILLFVQDELSYDQQWSDVDQKFRIQITFTPSGREPMSFSTGPGPMKHALKTYFPADVKHSARINFRRPTIRIGEDSYMDRIPYADPEITNIFDITPILGDVAAALNNPNDIVLSRERAIKYFGSPEAAMGKTMNLTFAGVVKDYQVAAIFEDFPTNNHISVPAMVKIVEEDFRENSPWFFSNWFSANNYIYFQLKDGANINTINSQMTPFIDGVGIETGDDAKASSYLDFTVYNLGDLHLYNTALGSLKSQGDINLIYAFIIIAALVLIIASINFMNLSTAQASQRSKEVSLRKVLGARKSLLISQFIAESIFLTVISLLLGLLMTMAILPVFNQSLDREIILNLTDPTIWGLILFMALVVGAAGGIYPSFVLSAFRPSEVLKANKSADTGGSTMVRNILVTFQFAISIGLIIATSVVYVQLSFFRDLDRGYQPDPLMVVQGMHDAGAGDRRTTYKEEVIKLPFVAAATIMSEGPGNANENNTTLTRAGMDNGTLIGRVDVDLGFLETYQVPLITGRGFSRDYAEDQHPSRAAFKNNDRRQANILLNETAVRKLGFSSPEDAIGQQVRMWFAMGDKDEPLYIEQTIIGVIQDAHFHSLKNVIRPEMYMVNSLPQDLVVRIKSGTDMMTAKEGLERIWQQIVPDRPFTSYQASERLSREFDAEVRQSNVFTAFAILAILISCLGLYGLASFVANRRTKEIGIRKVMGASIHAITRMMIWQFSIPVFVSALISVPLISWLMFDWLQRFPYRMDALWLFPVAVLAVIIALCIAWGTVLGHTLSVAKTNPIKALRYE